MIHRVSVDRRHLHLAAYMQAFGARLVDYRDDTFLFDTEETLEAWRARHDRSESYAVDKKLKILRDMVRTH